MDNPPWSICFPSILTDFEDGLSVSSVKTCFSFFFFDRPTHPQNQKETQSTLNKKRGGLNNILKYSAEDNVYLMNILLNHFRRNIFG